MTVIRTYHNVYDTHYHIVFPVKYRRALLTDEIPFAVVEIAKEIGLRYDFEFEKIGMDEDHIHILISFPPKYGGSDVVRIFKSITAKQLFKKFPNLKKDLWGGEFWSDGFYISTISKRGNWHTVQNYVSNQGKTIKSQQLRLLS